jgi:hypothetical protein
MARVRNPFAKDSQVFAFIKEHELLHHAPVSFHAIQKALGFTSGTLQTTLTRLLHSGGPFRIYETTRISSINNRIQRMFTTQPELANIPPIPKLDRLLIELESLSAGNLIDLGNEAILPLKMDKPTIRILQEIVSLSDEFSSVGALFSTAIMTYLQKHPQLVRSALNRMKNAEKPVIAQQISGVDD